MEIFFIWQAGLHTRRTRPYGGPGCESSVRKAESTLSALLVPSSPIRWRERRLLPAAQQFFKRVHARNVISQNMPFSTCRWFSFLSLSPPLTLSHSLALTSNQCSQVRPVPIDYVSLLTKHTMPAVSAHPLDPKLRNESRSRFRIQNEGTHTVISSQVDAVARNNGPCSNNGSLFSCVRVNRVGSEQKFNITMLSNHFFFF